MSTASDYYYICGDPTVPNSCKVHNTITVNKRVNVDLDVNGRVIGVESTSGLVDFEDLVDFLKIVTVHKE